jgi:integrase/recombinase XerD
MSDLHAAVVDYLALRRAVGFKLARADGMLNDFVDHLHARGLAHVTTEAALEWATLPHAADSWWWCRRLAVVRGFARYLQGIEPATEVPPAGLIHAVVPRAVPYVFSDSDVTTLMSAADRLKPALRAKTYQSLLGLLAVSGMRVSEAINLDDTDVDLADAVIVIRHAKFDKARELVIHPSTVEALDSYRRCRCRHRPAPSTAAFFVSTAGTRLHYPNVLGVFHRLIDEAGLQHRRHGRRPRLHDFRHGFAVQTVLDWYAADLDVGPRLAALSTYLGHARPADTYRYLSATPQLLGLAARRLETSQEAQP